VLSWLGAVQHGSWSISGWWLSPTPLKNDGVKVSWDLLFPIYGKRTNLQHPQPDMYHLYLSFGWVSAWSLYRLSTLKCVVRYTLHSKSTHPRSIRCSTNISREFVIKPRDTQAQAVMTNAQMSPALHPGIDERRLRLSTSGKRSHSQHIIQHTHKSRKQLEQWKNAGNLCVNFVKILVATLKEKTQSSTSFCTPE